MDENMPKDTNTAPAKPEPMMPVDSTLGKPAMPEPMKSGDNYNKDGGYGKKGGWGKWVLIYVVIAAVVYVAAYYIYKHYTGGASSTGSSLY